MTSQSARSFILPKMQDLDLETIGNSAGIRLHRFPNGQIFSFEQIDEKRRTMINQVLGSSTGGHMNRLILRLGDPQSTISLLETGVFTHTGTSNNAFGWRGSSEELEWKICLSMHPRAPAWYWDVTLSNPQDLPERPLDLVFVQDIGLARRDFLMTNEAYASHYLDHTALQDPVFGYVLVTRQNLEQEGKHPFVMHGCLDGAVSFASDFVQVFGPAHRINQTIEQPFGNDLPGIRKQRESACAALQSKSVVLHPGTTARFTFFGLFAPDHPEATEMKDLTRLATIRRPVVDMQNTLFRTPMHSSIDNAKLLCGKTLSDKDIQSLYQERTLEEHEDGRLLSFFTPSSTGNAHVVLLEKERRIPRRHGAILRSGDGMMPNESTLCVTAWMQGIFGSQLTIGNTVFHQLLSTSREPYGLVREGGLRIFVDTGDGWNLLGVPSAFHMELGSCRWIYDFGDLRIVIDLITSGREPAAQWSVKVAGSPCRFLAMGQLVLGEREYASAGRIEVDPHGTSATFRPDPQSIWGKAYPHAVLTLVTGTPKAIEAMGSDELLYPDSQAQSKGHLVIRTGWTDAFDISITGSLTHPGEAARLAKRYAGAITQSEFKTETDCFWNGLGIGLKLESPQPDADVESLNTIIPWLLHDALVHLSLPHGLEQYTGAAWGTRDVCQGPLELCLALERDDTVRAVLRIVFAQQYEHRGDWPQWFMLEPYSEFQETVSHGDIIVWPIKALCDFVEATGELSFLNESIAWRHEGTSRKTDHAAPVSGHIEKLLETIQERLVPGTALIRYGDGDWNDTLQPVNALQREQMVSSWTVALLHEQIVRYAGILVMAGQQKRSAELFALAVAMQDDFHRYLMRDGIVAGYAIFEFGGADPTLIFHPSDTRTGISCSLISMTQPILGRLFTPEQASNHIDLIRSRLLLPDGAHLMDRPIAYSGGLERLFRRAESASFFGREVGLMYVHAHLRYAEAMAATHRPEDFWDALMVVNPIRVTEILPQAILRQRNAYFSSSDAAFNDRYQASNEWDKMRSGKTPVEGGWRIYSSGSGLFISILIQRALGLRRWYGKRIIDPCLPERLTGLRLTGLKNT